MHSLCCTSRRWVTFFALASLFSLASRAGALSLLPPSPTSVDRVQVTITGPLLGCRPVFVQPQVMGSTIRIDGTTPSCPPPPGPPTFWSAQVLVGPLAAGDYTIDVYLDQSLFDS